MSLQPVSLRHIMENPPPAPEPLLSPWLMEQSFTVLQAAPKVGKTWLSLAAALAVAGGGRFLGWSAPKPRKVLYVDAENGRRRIYDRMRYLIGSIEGIDPEAAIDNFDVIGKKEHEGGTKGKPFPLIDGKEGSQQYVDVVKEYGASLIVLDTMSRLVDLDDENASAAYRPLGDTVSDLAEAGCAVLLLHHLRKGGRGSDPDAARGSGALGATVDLQIGMSRCRKGVDDLAAFKVDAAADRDGVTMSQKAKLQLGRGAARWVNGEASTAADDGETKLERVLRVAGSGQFERQKDLAAALGMDAGELSKLKKRAENDGDWTEGQLKAAMEAPAAAVAT
ncbi:hypothetical protein T35B1_16463 [Salinisphaera shabanensis T35B1]|uniref:AAA family ATPase n=1 Tax=Salinisphaera shabanensis TaxID=180542 RepID=UPI00334248EA